MPGKVIKSQFEVLPFFSAIFIAGLVFSQLFNPHLSFLFSFLTIASLLSTFIKTSQKVTGILLIVATFCAGLFYGNLRIRPEVDAVEFQLLHESKGQLHGILNGEFKMLKTGSVSFYLRECKFFTASQTISIPGRVYCRVKSTNILPEPEQYYLLDGIFKFDPTNKSPSFKASNLTHVPGRNELSTLGGKIQRKLRDGLNMVLPSRHAAVVTGFLLGDTSLINFKDRQLFRKTGVSHLLAVSGQHIMLLSFILAALLHWLKIPPVSRTILTAVFLVIYALTTTGSASVLRALLMFLVTAVIFHLESFPSPIRALSLSALILLIYNPGYIVNAAFVLSYTAVSGIILLRPMLEYYLVRMHIPRVIGRYLSVTFAANISIIPVAAHFFSSLSIIAFLVNPFITWLFAIILPLGFAVGTVSALSPEYGLFLAPGLSLSLDGLFSILEQAAAIPGGYIYTGNISGFLTALIYIALIMIYGYWNQRIVSPKAIVESKTQEIKTKPVRQVGKTATSEKTASYRASFNKSVEPRQIIESRNIFLNQKFVSEIDAIMLSCKRRSLKNLPHYIPPFPIDLISLENQNLFYQLIDLDLKVLQNESYRLIQAQVYLMSFSGGIILNRISSHLNPPPDPSDIKVDMVIKNRFLASAILGDEIVNSRLINRTQNQNFILLLNRGQSLFYRAKNQLKSMLENQSKEKIDQHFSLRRDMLKWCVEFIEFDQETRKS
ncbi:MAG: ComEC/Rec2 family competence protein [Candidatus Rifleibacteriota bacterium]